MVLWKCLIGLTFLLVVTAAESDEDVSSSAELPINITNYLPTNENGDKLEQMIRTFMNTPRTEQIAVFNDYTDKLIAELNTLIYMKGYDPMKMQDLVHNWKYKPLIITYSGEMSLKNGSLQGLGTMKRTGDVTVWYEYPNVKIRIPLGYDVILFDYRYKAKFMGIGPAGGMNGRSTNCRFTIDIHVNMITLLARLEKFNLYNIGSISLKFTGYFLGDKIRNIFVAVMIPFIKPVITWLVEDFIPRGLVKVINEYNSVICDILNCQ